MHRIVVVNDEDHVIGMISLSDILSFLALKPMGLERTDLNASNELLEEESEESSDSSDSESDNKEQQVKNSNEDDEDDGIVNTLDLQSKLLTQTLPDGRITTPFPYKVAKALDSRIYRNVELDCWLDKIKNKNHKLNL